MLERCFKEDAGHKLCCSREAVVAARTEDAALPRKKREKARRYTGELGEGPRVERLLRTAVYCLATLQLARLLGASRETKRVCGERQHGRRLPVGNCQLGSRRFASERSGNPGSKF